METMKRFLLDDSGTSEATSAIIMIAAAGILLAAGVAIYFAGVNDFCTSAAASVKAYAGKIPN
jgi:hypothetical protein